MTNKDKTQGMGNRGDLKGAQKKFPGTKAKAMWDKAKLVCSILASLFVIIDPGLRPAYDDSGHLEMIF